MDFSFDEPQQEVQNLARKILGDLVTNERLREIEAGESGVDLDLWRKLGTSNLLGVGIGEAYGGSELGFLTLCLLLEEVGRSVAPAPVLASLALGALPLERFGSDAQKQRWLPGVASGEIILTGALQEPGNQAPVRPATLASRDGSGWRLDGVKICVPAAHLAQRATVPAQDADGRPLLFLVDPSAPGVALTRQRTTDRQPHFELAMTGAVVSEADRIGSLADGTEILQWLTERATAAYCAVQLGVSERALEMSAEYTGSRVQFDRPIGSFQAVHMRAGDAYIALEAIRLTLWEAAWRLSVGLPAGDQVAVAKFWAAEGGQFVGYAAQHLHGGIGIDVDYPLHRYYLWAKQLELTLGSAPVQLARIGERIAQGSAPACGRT